MGKSVSLYLFILLWTIYGCFFIETLAERSHQSRSNQVTEDDSQKSITCYDCNSEYDPNCGEKFEPTTLGKVNCSLRPTPEHLNQSLTAVLCRKLVMKIYGKIRVYRGCGYVTSHYDDQQCVKRSGTHDVHVWHCSCTKDLCNSAPKSIGAPSSLTLTSLIGAVYYLLSKNLNANDIFVT